MTESHLSSPTAVLAPDPISPTVLASRLIHILLIFAIVSPSATPSPFLMQLTALLDLRTIFVPLLPCTHVASAAEAIASLCAARLHEIASKG